MLDHTDMNWFIQWSGATPYPTRTTWMALGPWSAMDICMRCPTCAPAYMLVLLVLGTPLHSYDL